MPKSPGIFFNFNFRYTMTTIGPNRQSLTTFRMSWKHHDSSEGIYAQRVAAIDHTSNFFHSSMDLERDAGSTSDEYEWVEVEIEENHQGNSSDRGVPDPGAQKFKTGPPFVLLRPEKLPIRVGLIPPRGFVPCLKPDLWNVKRGCLTPSEVLAAAKAKSKPRQTHAKPTRSAKLLMPRPSSVEDIKSHSF